MTHPICRSAILWLGLPGFCFIIWAWHDSVTRQTSYHCYRNIDGQVATPLNILNVGSKIESLWPSVELGPSGTQSQDPWQYSRVPPTYREPLFPAPAYHEYPRDPTIHGSRVAFCQLIVPHWLILSVYLMLWAGLVFWRYRQIRTRMRPVVA